MCLIVFLLCSGNNQFFVFISFSFQYFLCDIFFKCFYEGNSYIKQRYEKSWEDKGKPTERCLFDISSSKRWYLKRGKFRIPKTTHVQTLNKKPSTTHLPTELPQSHFATQNGCKSLKEKHFLFIKRKTNIKKNKLLLGHLSLQLI